MTLNDKIDCWCETPQQISDWLKENDCYPPGAIAGKGQSKTYVYYMIFEEGEIYPFGFIDLVDKNKVKKGTITEVELFKKDEEDDD
jgi:hypothetical protein